MSDTKMPPIKKKPKPAGAPDAERFTKEEWAAYAKAYAEGKRAREVDRAASNPYPAEGVTLIASLAWEDGAYDFWSSLDVGAFRRNR